MLKVDLTDETVFSFGGPNLCLLGSEDDFKKLFMAVVELTNFTEEVSVNLNLLDFVEFVGDKKKLIIFSNLKGADKWGVFTDNNELVFQIDSNYWDRVCKFFALMGFSKRTYYLNVDEDCLKDLDLAQECSLICSSEW